MGNISPNKISKLAHKKKSKLVQARLQFNYSQKNSSKLIQCPKCGMAYSSNSIADIQSHKVYHSLHMCGHKWSKTWGKRISLSENPLTPPSTSSSPKTAKQLLNFQSETEYIVEVRPDVNNEVKAGLELMKVVNDELNAPHDENSFWTNKSENGKLFLYIKNERAVGALSVELINSTRSRWMVYDSKKVVDHVRPNFKLGISRIWVCKEQRSKGIAPRLLETARIYTLPNRTVQRWELAWSQPTESGGKLASKYNGMKHKSGKLLIPCYI